MLAGRGPALPASSSFIQEARHLVLLEALRDVEVGLLVLCVCVCVCVHVCMRAGSSRESVSAIRR